MLDNFQETRFGGWIETFTGRHFWPLDPRPDELCIDDIAHALASICRFNGHCARHYSVAEHSLFCAQYARAMGWSEEVQLACLMHDASEAYLCDIPSPIKPYLHGYAEAEERLQRLIWGWLGLCVGDNVRAKIHEADTFTRNIEACQLMPEHCWAVMPGIPLGLSPLTPLTQVSLKRDWESCFLLRHRLLANRVKKGT